MKTVIEKEHRLVTGIVLNISLQTDKFDSHFVCVETKGHDYPVKENFLFGYNQEIEIPAEEQIETQARKFYESVTREFCLEWMLGKILNHLSASIIIDKNFKRENYGGC